VSVLTRRIRYALWALTSRTGRAISCGVPARVTVLLACFSPARVNGLSPQVRHLLRCPFVERIVVSNHNPGLRLPADLPTTDPRVVVVSQPVQRRCGYRWLVAQTFDPAYLIVLDDDVRLYPSQLARLFEYLVGDPSVPHGVAGLRQVADTECIFVERTDANVDFLCEVYAITGQHLRRYEALRARLEEAPSMGELIDRSCDFVVLGRTGDGRPQIHDLGRIHRCETFNQVGVALHKDPSFREDVREVLHALKRSQTLTHDAARPAAAGGDRDVPPAERV
jgi:hypothetical protein